MAIDNDLYSREDFVWWNDDPNSHGVLLRYFINPIRFTYFCEVMKQTVDTAVSGSKILDVGCGGGYLCEEFAKMGFQVTGIDPSRRTIQGAKAHSVQTHLFIDYWEGRAESLPFDDSSFDYVSCCDVLEHVDDLGKTISEISRALKPGGLFFYDTINRTFASWLLVIKVGQDWKYSAWEPPNAHEWERFVRPSELRAIFTNNHLAMHEIKGIGSGNRRSVIWKAIRERAKGRITRYEMGTRFGFKKNDETDIAYMGFASKQQSARASVVSD